MASLPAAGAVANMSWGFPVTTDPAQADSLEMLEDATFDLLDVGVTVVTSAGNTGELACHQSPSRMSPLHGVLSVAALTKDDERIWASNFGDCVTLSAPGDTMLVAFPFDPTDYDQIRTLTSGAAAQVSGAAALYLALHPSSSPEQVETALLKYAHRDVLRSSLTPSTLLVSTRFMDSVAVTADPTRLGGTFLGINEGVAVRCHGYHASGTELDQVRCRWHSSDTTIAVVSPTGLVYGRAPGTVRINGESGPARDSVTLTVLSPIRAEPLPIRARRSVHFYNQMVGPGGTTTQVEWWLGDGTYGVGESWPHRYMSSGVYNVTMCVHGWAGVSCHSKQVTVYP
jgi:subtilisin family serine protease